MYVCVCVCELEHSTGRQGEGRNQEVAERFFSSSIFDNSFKLQRFYILLGFP